MSCAKCTGLVVAAKKAAELVQKFNDRHQLLLAIEALGCSLLRISAAIIGCEALITRQSIFWAAASYYSEELLVAGFCNIKGYCPLGEPVVFVE
jgi:hypothetical protein